MTDARAGTSDPTYDLVSVTYHALQGAETFARYERDAQDEEVSAFFGEAQQKQREIAERAKSLLARKLA